MSRLQKRGGYDQHDLWWCFFSATIASAIGEAIEGYSLPDNAKQLLLTCRQLSYYRHGRGIHPVEVQFQRTANSEPWQIVFFISFSYPFESALNVQPELYFHLVKGWCYQRYRGGKP